MDSAQAQEQLWKRMPRSSSIFFYSGVFCLFGALLLVVSSPGLRSQSIGDMVRTVVVAGSFAILWAYAAVMRRYWLFAALFPLQFVVTYLLGRYGPVHHSLASDLPALQHKIMLTA